MTSRRGVSLLELIVAAGAFILLATCADSGHAAVDPARPPEALFAGADCLDYIAAAEDAVPQKPAGAVADTAGKE